MLTVPAKLTRTDREVRLIVAPSVGANPPSRRDTSLIKLIVRDMRRERRSKQRGRPVSQKWRRPKATHFAVLLRLSYLSPALMASVLEGTQPAWLTRQRLARMALPLLWKDQWLAYPAAGHRELP